MFAHSDTNTGTEITSNCIGIVPRLVGSGLLCRACVNLSRALWTSHCCRGWPVFVIDDIRHFLIWITDSVQKIRCPSTHVAHNRRLPRCQICSHLLDTLSLVWPRVGTWVERAGGGELFLCWYQYDMYLDLQYQWKSGKQYTGQQYKQLHAHMLAVNSPDLLYSHMGSIKSVLFNVFWTVDAGAEYTSILAVNWLSVIVFVVFSVNRTCEATRN